jgi:hypothetical protein
MTNNIPQLTPDTFAGEQLKSILISQGPCRIESVLAFEAEQVNVSFALSYQKVFILETPELQVAITGYNLLATHQPATRSQAEVLALLDPYLFPWKSPHA